MSAAPPDGTDREWDAIRARLARAATATRRAARTSRRDAARILQERALALAQPQRPPEALVPRLRLVTFAVAGERLAIEARFVRAVGRRGAITPLPATPPHVIGVTSFRGEVVAVFDIGRTPAERPEGETRPHILFLGRTAIEFGVLADSVDEVIQAAPEDLGARPWRPDEPAHDGVSGVTADALNVLDGAALLDDDRFIIEQEGSGPAGLGGNG